MKIDQLNIVLRPRSAYEGLDLGFAVAARNFRPLWILWLATALPVTLVCHLLFFNRPLVAIFLIWWAKPLFESPLLHWLSRSVFNEAPEPKALIRSLHTLVAPQLLSRLTWRRFSPNRSFFMPVLFLEGMRGADYTERSAVLGLNQTAGFALTFICFLFEGLLSVSALLLLDIMIPEALMETSLHEWLFNAKGAAALLPNAMIICAMSIVAPFYVAGGFLLYLTRRTLLEAWDIELKFKRMVSRISRQKIVLLLPLIFWGAICADTVAPVEARAFEIDKETAAKCIEEVLEDEDFGSRKTVTRWRLKPFDMGFDREIPSLDGVIALLARSITLLVKLALWIAGGILMAFFLYTLARQFGFTRPGRHKNFQAPETLFGLSLNPDSMPDDIAEEAANLLKAGDVRTALSLLYRGALFHMVHQSFIEIPESATEGECMALARKYRPEHESAYFRNLTRLWLRMAYGHIRPDPRKVTGLLSVWKDFYAAK